MSEQLSRDVERDDLPTSDPGGQPPAAAWEQLEAGRFMPRRIRGSCLGRALG